MSTSLPVKYTTYRRWEATTCRVTETPGVAEPTFVLNADANPMSRDALAELHALLGVVLEAVPVQIRQVPTTLDPAGGVV